MAAKKLGLVPCIMIISKNNQLRTLFSFIGVRSVAMHEVFFVKIRENPYGAGGAMPTEIKCERMTTWNFDHCHECRRFRVRRGKGLNNRGCAHNDANTKERRDFGMIWAATYLQDRAMA